MIQRFLDNIEKAIGSHPAILSSTLQKQIGPGNNTIYLKGAITQYMDKRNQIVFRYDNAPHHKELSTFPHHKHLADRVLPSARPTIADILDEISAVLLAGRK